MGDKNGTLDVETNAVDRGIPRHYVWAAAMRCALEVPRCRACGCCAAAAVHGSNDHRRIAAIGLSQRESLWDVLHLPVSAGHDLSGGRFVSRSSRPESLSALPPQD